MENIQPSIVLNEEIPEGLPTVVRRQIIRHQTQLGIESFRLGASSAERRLLLDPQCAEYVTTFLKRTPRIKTLVMCCNIERNQNTAGEGVREILANYFRQDECAISALSLVGESNLPWDSDLDEDDGSLIECFSEAIQSNTSLVRISLEDTDFHSPKRFQEIQTLMIHCRQRHNLHEIAFRFCRFPAIDHTHVYVTPTTTATNRQQGLKSVYIAERYEDSDAESAQFFRMIRHCLPMLNALSVTIRGPKHHQILEELLPILSADDCNLERLVFRGRKCLFHNNGTTTMAETFCQGVKQNMSLVTVMGGALDYVGPKQWQVGWMRRNRAIRNLKQTPTDYWGEALVRQLFHNPEHDLSPAYFALTELLPRITGGVRRPS